MKFGLRTPSLKRSFKARTTGRAKRAVKKALIPGYGKKGMGWLKNPKKPHITRCIIKHHSVYGIYSNNDRNRRGELRRFFSYKIHLI